MIWMQTKITSMFIYAAVFSGVAYEYAIAVGRVVGSSGHRGIVLGARRSFSQNPEVDLTNNMAV